MQRYKLPNVKNNYTLKLIICLTVFSFFTKAQDEVNLYKKLTKQFIGAVKRNEPYKNYRFFDTSVYGRMTESYTDKLVTDFIKQDVNLAVDLSKKGVGEHELRFRSDQFKIPLSDLTNISPPLIKVILDKEVKNRVAVRPLLSTQLPEGYKVDGVVVQPSMIEIKGSRRRVGLISSILSSCGTIPTIKINSRGWSFAAEMTGQFE